MATLSESQAFLDQFDKCLPLCERGDVVTVVNALHSLNEITQAGLAQALELDPASGHDFVCSFLLELELALELYISPLKKLGTIDGGLPMLYSYNDEELLALADVPSQATKTKVLKFLKALGVVPSSGFATRSVKDAVSEFMAAQVKPTSKATPPVLRSAKTAAFRGRTCAAAEATAAAVVRATTSFLRSRPRGMRRMWQWCRAARRRSSSRRWSVRRATASLVHM